MNANEDNNGFYVSEFDEMRLRFLEVDKQITSECGTWQVHRYQNEYLILTFTENPITIDGVKTAEEVIKKLKKLSNEQQS